jgi:hypothetical protein
LLRAFFGSLVVIRKITFTPAHLEMLGYFSCQVITCPATLPSWQPFGYQPIANL